MVKGMNDLIEAWQRLGNPGPRPGIGLKEALWRLSLLALGIGVVIFAILYRGNM